MTTLKSLTAFNFYDATPFLLLEVLLYAFKLLVDLCTMKNVSFANQNASEKLRKSWTETFKT